MNPTCCVLGVDGSPLERGPVQLLRVSVVGGGDVFAVKGLSFYKLCTAHSAVSSFGALEELQVATDRSRGEEALQAAISPLHRCPRQYQIWRLTR